MLVAAVGVALELAVVGPPGVGGFDDPSQPEGEAVWGAGFGFGASFLDIEIDQATLVKAGSDLGVVVAAIETQRADLLEESVG